MGAAENFDTGSDSLLASATRNIRRVRRVVGIIARHGFAELFTKSPLGKSFFRQIDVAAEGGPGPSAKRLRQLIEELGPTYIKFGQILSVRHDLLPPDYIAALAALQDQNSPLPFEGIKARIENDMGASLQELFKEFDPKPLATASIAQTHLAVTHEGRQVVVKIQRPGIADVIRSDIDILFMLAKLLEASIEEMKLFAPSEIVTEFEKAIVSELDFTRELANLEKARQYLVPERAVVVPEPFPTLSCRTVLTMEFFPGRSLRKLEPSSPLAQKAAEELAHSFCKQILVDGFFHGDPHAGNILINDEGTVCLIDYGQVGELTPAQLQEVVMMLLALFTKDINGAVRSALSFSRATERVSLANLKSELKAFLDKYFTDTTILDNNPQELIQDLVAVLQRHKLKPPQDFVVVVKAVATIEGLIRHLHPEMDAAAILMPYVQGVVAKRFSPKGLFQESVAGLSGLAQSLRSLPGQLDQILYDAERGHFQVRIVSPQLDELPSMLHQVGGKMALAGFAMTSAVCGALLVVAGRDVEVGYGGIGVSLVAWLVLLLWQLLGRAQPIRVRAIMQFFKR